MQTGGKLDPYCNDCRRNESTNSSGFACPNDGLRNSGSLCATRDRCHRPLHHHVISLIYKKDISVLRCYLMFDG